MTYFAEYKTLTEMYDCKYNEMYNKLMKKWGAGEKKCEEELQIGKKAEADVIAKFKLIYGDIDLDDEDDGTADISGTNIVTSTPDESVKGTNMDSPSGNLSSFQAGSGKSSNTTKLDDLSLKVNVGKQSNLDVSRLDDFEILCNPTVYGSFMWLVGIDNKLVDLEILKSPQVVASYVRFTDINICTTVTDPLPSQKCSELASELKVEKSDQTKDDSSIKKRI